MADTTIHAKEKYTAKQLAEIFRYDPDTGELFFRKTNTLVPRSTSETSRRVTYKGTATATSSIAYALMMGEWPGALRIKYRDGNRDNQRWKNMWFVPLQTGVPRNVKHRETSSRKQVLNLIESKPKHSFSLSEIRVILPDLPHAAVSTSLTALRREGKIHISGVCNRSYAVYGRVALSVSAGAAPEGWSIDSISFDKEEVRRIIREEVLTKRLQPRVRARATARMVDVEDVRIGDNLAPAQLPDEDDDAWHKDAVERSKAAMEQTMIELRQTRVPMSIFALAAAQRAPTIRMSRA